MKLKALARLPLLAYLVVITAFYLQGPAAWANTISLRWTAPTTNTDGSALTNLRGYKVYYGEISAAGDKSKYSTGMPVGNTTTATVSQLSAGRRYYFAVAAIADVESALSNEVSALIPTAESNPNPDPLPDSKPDLVPDSGPDGEPDAISPPRIKCQLVKRTMGQSLTTQKRYQDSLATLSSRLANVKNSLIKFVAVSTERLSKLEMRIAVTGDKLAKLLGVEWNNEIRAALLEIEPSDLAQVRDFVSTQASEKFAALEKKDRNTLVRRAATRIRRVKRLANTTEELQSTAAAFQTLDPDQMQASGIRRALRAAKRINRLGRNINRATNNLSEVTAKIAELEPQYQFCSS